MLEQKVRIISETLARAVDRRTFLRKAGSGVVSGVAALALGSTLSSSVAWAATSKGKRPAVPTISCAPPGPYCNTGGGNLSGCHGAHCYQHLSGGNVVACHVYYAFYSVGCWTSSDGWTCCDCQCDGGATCGCAEQLNTPVTLSE
jgi:hypothetical protein